MSLQSSVASMPTKKYLAFALGFRRKEELASYCFSPVL